MRPSQIVDMLLAENNPSFKYIKVKFAQGPHLYTYKTTEAVEPGDIMVVFARGEHKCVEVVEVLDINDVDLTVRLPYDIVWAVSRVDTKASDACLEMERVTKDTIKKERVKAARKEVVENLDKDVVHKVLTGLKKL